MCKACTEAWMRWLDYRPPPPIRLVQIGPPHANVPWGERTRETIRSQQALIRDLCARGKHVPER